MNVICHLSNWRFYWPFSPKLELGIFPVHEMTLKVYGSFREPEIYRVPGSGLLSNDPDKNCSIFYCSAATTLSSR